MEVQTKIKRFVISRLQLNTFGKCKTFFVESMQNVILHETKISAISVCGLIDALWNGMVCTLKNGKVICECTVERTLHCLLPEFY